MFDRLDVNPFVGSTHSIGGPVAGARHRTVPAYHSENSEALDLATSVVAVRARRVSLATDPFYRGGGGRLPDRGLLRRNGGERAVLGFGADEARTWLVLDGAGRSLGAGRSCL